VKRIGCLGDSGNCPSSSLSGSPCGLGLLSLSLSWGGNMTHIMHVLVVSSYLQKIMYQCMIDK
jgi:hypothetical protein